MLTQVAADEEVVAEVEDAAAEAVAAANAPLSNIPTTFRIFKDGGRNEANAINQIVQNGVGAAASTLIILVTVATRPTESPVTTLTRYGLTVHVSQQVVAHETATFSSPPADGVGWNQIKIVM